MTASAATIVVIAFFIAFRPISKASLWSSEWIKRFEDEGSMSFGIAQSLFRPWAGSRLQSSLFPARFQVGANLPWHGPERRRSTDQAQILLRHGCASSRRDRTSP